MDEVLPLGRLAGGVAGDVVGACWAAPWACSAVATGAGSTACAAATGPASSRPTGRAAGASWGGAAHAGEWAIDVAAEGEGGLRVVQLLADGAVVGGRLVGEVDLHSDHAAEDVHAESSVEARVAMALVERGVDPDLCAVARLIDGATALAVRSQADVDALAQSVAVSQAVFVQASARRRPRWRRPATPPGRAGRPTSRWRPRPTGWASTTCSAPS
ncbi:MAG: hypothetical protein R3F60_01385 [bacterium]